MKLIKLLPYNSILGDDETTCALWKREIRKEPNLCEYSNEWKVKGEKIGRCDNSGFYYGTDDSNEPKFCARHFYQIIVNGDGKTNYKLTR